MSDENFLIDLQFDRIPTAAYNATQVGSTACTGALVQPGLQLPKPLEENQSSRARGMLRRL